LGGDGRVCVSTYGAACAAPFLETGAMEDMLARDGEEASCVVHTLETYRAGGKFDEVRCRGWDRTQESRGRRCWRERVMREFGKACIGVHRGRCLECYGFDVDTLTSFWLRDR
jgi:hypothetical protein